MPIQTWGDMEKSQIDPEKIEEAIARMIEEHNDDPEAHLGAEQSLNSHKSYDIIDHVVRSVVRDKINFDRFQIDEPFFTIDNWTTSGDVAIEFYGVLTLYAKSGVTPVSIAAIYSGDANEEQGYRNRNPILQLRARLSSVANVTAYIGKVPEDWASGFGFKIVNSNVYVVWYNDDEVEQTQLIKSGLNTKWHIYRYECVDGEQIKFYIDDELLYILTFFQAIDNSLYCQCYLSAGAAADKYLYISNLHFDANYSI